MKYPVTGKLKIGDTIVCFRPPFTDDISVVKSIEGKKALTSPSGWILNTDIYFKEIVYRYGERYNPYMPGPTFTVQPSLEKETYTI